MRWVRERKEAAAAAETVEAEAAGEVAAETEALQPVPVQSRELKVKLKQRQNDKRHVIRSDCKDSCRLHDVVCLLHSSQTRINDDEFETSHTHITSSVGAHSRPDQHG